MNDKTNIVKLISLFIFLSINFSFAQEYKVNYKTLPSTLFPGSKPNICILENISSNDQLYNQLIKYNDVFIRYEIYSTEFLNANKNILGKELDPENPDFLSSLYKNFGIDYLLNWVNVEDSSGAYRLTIYSTKNQNKLFEKEIYRTVNSNPALDVEKLLVDNIEPFYSGIKGQLEVETSPAEVNVKLYKDGNLIKAWTGQAEIKVEPGKYKLITEAQGYKKDERDVEITGNKSSTINIVLEQELYIPNVYPLDNYIANIKAKNNGKNLEINYDLTGEKNTKYNVIVSFTDKTTGKSFDLKMLSGDYKDVQSGKNKFITWDYKDELGNSKLNNCEIKLSAEKISGGTTWYYYVGGALVGGGVAAILLLKKSSNQVNPPPPSLKYPAPPNRPN